MSEHLHGLGDPSVAGDDAVFEDDSSCDDSDSGLESLVGDSVSVVP